MTNHPFSAEPFSNVQCELPPTQLHAISLCPIAGHQRDQHTHSRPPPALAAPLEEAVDCDEVTAGEEVTTCKRGEEHINTK